MAREPHHRKTTGPVTQNSDSIQIGFFGGGEQALAALIALAGRPEYTISFIHPRIPDDVIVTEFARRHLIAVMPVDNVNSKAGLGFIRDQDMDLMLSINCKQIFKPDLLSLPRLGAVNLHNGMLPRQRGGGGAYAGMINGETCGTTLHFIDQGIDDGDIIIQRPVDVTADMTMGDLQRKFIAHTPTLVIDALEKIIGGNLVRTSQKQSQYYYVPAKPEWDELIDWTLPTDAIYDRFRARTPGPDSFFIFKNEMIYVTKIELEPKLLAHTNAPGQVLQRSREKGVLVKTGDTGIWVNTILRQGTEEETIPTFPIGSMLAQNIHKKVFELEKRLSRLELEFDKK